MFTLVVDNFGVRYERQEDIAHLITCVKSKYDLSTDWTGNFYCGICLKWDYKQRTLDILMPEYIQKELQEYKHTSPLHLQQCPYAPILKQYGSEAQHPLPPDKSPPLSNKNIKHIQWVIGSILLM